MINCFLVLVAIEACKHLHFTLTEIAPVPVVHKGSLTIHYRFDSRRDVMEYLFKHTLELSVVEVDFSFVASSLKLTWDFLTSCPCPLCNMLKFGV